MATFHLLFVYCLLCTVYGKINIPYHTIPSSSSASCLLVICIYVDVEQQMVKDAALWKAISMPAPSAALADEVNKKRLFDSMFLVSSVSLTSCIISNHFLVRILWFTVS